MFHGMFCCCLTWEVLKSVDMTQLLLILNYLSLNYCLKVYTCGWHETHPKSNGFCYGFGITSVGVILDGVLPHLFELGMLRIKGKRGSKILVVFNSVAWYHRNQ